jgi:hypothetical protein
MPSLFFSPLLPRSVKAKWRDDYTQLLVMLVVAIWVVAGVTLIARRRRRPGLLLSPHLVLRRIVCFRLFCLFSFFIHTSGVHDTLVRTHSITTPLMRVRIRVPRRRMAYTRKHFVDMLVSGISSLNRAVRDPQSISSDVCGGRLCRTPNSDTIDGTNDLALEQDAHEATEPRQGPAARTLVGTPRRLVQHVYYPHVVQTVNWTIPRLAVIQHTVSKVFHHHSEMTGGFANDSFSSFAMS